MLLRKLEAFGFKSFADRTEVEFGEGITGIVGPNGSGKSNISDAIRWVLGEQSVKNLRGTKMEDVIFAGSAGRRPLGAAEVSLIFDNTDASLPLDFNEVIITRRVFRSGDSEYFINKSNCRLKDIHDLLSDTGLGRDAMTVIGQNKVDEILNSKPEDRRLIFEEAAGISKYKQRKKDSLRKLEDTTNNLIRVSDIIGEIETQLEPLAESAQKTRQFNYLNGELTAFQVTLLLNKLTKAKKMVESTVLQREHLADDELKGNTNLLSLESEKESLSLQVIESEECLNGLNSTINQTETALERLNGKTTLLDERVSQGKNTLFRVQADTARLKQQKIDYTQKKSLITATRKENEEKINEVRSSISLENNRYQQLINSIESLQHKIEDDKEKSFEHIQEVVSERNKLANLERELARLQIRHDNIAKEQETYHLQNIETEKLLDATNQEQLTFQNTLTVHEQHYQELAIQQDKIEKKLQEFLRQEKKLNDLYNELHSRYKVLSSMQHEYEGFTRGIKHILKSTASWRSDVCGAVAQIIHAPDQYVTAIEIALGGALQNIITKNEQVAKQAIEFLKTHNLGRATFLPLNIIKGKRVKESDLTSQVSGFIGIASDLVECEPVYRNAVDFLLGRILVAQNLNAALLIAKETSYSLKVVTLDGEVVNPGGAMTGGSIHRKEAGLLSRNNEIQNIENRLAVLNEDLQQNQSALENCRNNLSIISEQQNSLSKARQEIEIRQAEVAVHLEKLKVDKQRLALSLSTFNEEINDCTKEKTKLEAAIKYSQEQIAFLETRDIQHKQSIDEWQNQLKELQDLKENLSNKITNLKIQEISLEKENSAILANEEQFLLLEKSVDEQLLHLESERVSTETLINQTTIDLEKIHQQCSDLLLQKESYTVKRDECYKRKLNQLATLQKIEKEVKELRKKQNDLQSRLHEIELLHAKYSYEHSYCHEQLQQRFSLTLDAAYQIYREKSNDEIYSQVDCLEKEIAALGPINPAAIEEYERLNERYEFLQKQYADLAGAKEYLISIIHDIDQTMSVKFTHAFKQISEHFSEIFVKLFGGGKADLILLDPDNILETGIEITVQPPGKKAQNLILLSGGERALTVIALLFAVLTHKPAPFVVVDEIDAALDEANVERFSHFLRDYAKDTQFIVVTHRKGTMEAANVIHGVTIEESGVSRLVSVKLMDKAG